jgi:hypothetical protein
MNAESVARSNSPQIDLLDNEEIDMQVKERMKPMLRHYSVNMTTDMQITLNALQNDILLKYPKESTCLNNHMQTLLDRDLNIDFSSLLSTY